MKMLTKLHRWLDRAVPLLGILLICFAVIIGLAPVQANTPAIQNTVGNTIDAKLENQVLAIIRKNPGIVREAMQAEEQQKQQEQQALKQRFNQEMQKNPGIVIGNSPVKGAKNQKLLLIEFADFQCPYCAQAHTILKQFMERNQDKVTLVYKHYPLTSIHPEATAAAKAAFAAQKQGKFWQYHDALFERQAELGEKLYIEIAQNLQLDIAKFNQQRNSPEFGTALDQDLKMAETLGIQGTPFFFVNGETVSGAVPLPELEKLVASAKTP
jgi:protein-disulfide isomerase